MHRPKRSESDMARQLVLEHGTKAAHQKAVGERTRARRARSRNEFQYWSAVISKIAYAPQEVRSDWKGEASP
jgi:hypothetical protein